MNNYIEFFTDYAVVDELLHQSTTRQDYTVTWVLKQLKTVSLADIILELIDASDKQNHKFDLDLSNSFFALSELTNIDKQVADFCLDVSVLLSLDEDSRTYNINLKDSFAQIKSLADVNIC